MPLDSIGSLNDDQPVATVRASLGETMSAGTGVIRRATFAMPLTDVTPGAYQTRVKVTAGSETVADLTRELEIVAGSQAAASSGRADPRSDPQDVLDGDFVRAARAALRASTAPAAVRATKGFELFAQGDYGSAAAELAEALKLDQTSAATAFVLGWAYEEAGHRREAIGAWRAAATIDPEDGAGAPRARRRLHADVRTRAGGTGDPRGADGHARIAGAAGQARANPGEIMIDDR